MRLRIFNRAIHPSGKPGFDAIVAGCRAVGDECDYTDDLIANCDVAVHASGPKGGSMAQSDLSVCRRILIDRFGKNRLILESPVIRPGLVVGNYWRLSLGGFLRGSEYANENSPSDRWERISSEQGIEPRDFHVPQDGHVLIMLQKPSDASLSGSDHYNWARAMIAQVKQYVDWPIVLRPHPLNKESTPAFEGATVSSGSEKDWDNARAVITFTSLSAIDSLLRGLPTWTMSPGNLAYEMTNRSLSRLENPWFPHPADFDQWLANLAYTQWSPDEIRSGEPWSRLRATL